MAKISLKKIASDRKEGSDVKVFNQGSAGRVKNVTLKVTKKGPEDKDNAPDWKVNFFDEAGGTVNLGVYYPKETTTDKEISIRIDQLLSILETVDPSLDANELPEFDTYKEMFDFLCKSIAQKQNGVKCNIFVTYGTKKRPSKYLEFRAYNIIEPSDTDDNVTKLVPVRHKDEEKALYNDIMSRHIDEDPFSISDEPTEETETEKWY